MKPMWGCALLAVAGVFLGQTPAVAQVAPGSGSLRSPEAREAAVRRLAAESGARRAEAWRVADAAGWAPRGPGYELQAIRNGRLYVYHTFNANAAISTAANLVRNTAPYNANGAGETVGVWDGGAARTTHVELTGRVTIMDGGVLDDHATHVTGTIAASGVAANARGMAPSIRINSWEWNDDTAEMLAQGMALSGEAGKIQLSNHSYGFLAGWTLSGSTYYWYGVWGQREDAGFGQYDVSAWEWDDVCYNTPYYLPCIAAGNDRDDNAPPTNTRFYYWSGGAWRSKRYNPSTDPYSDGYDNGGFDTIAYAAVAKNVLTVGAVADAVAGGSRYLASAAILPFSSWGPADDGRIKPDVVGNGYQLYSCLAGNNTSYGTYSGTSMATPNVCGSLALLTDYYGIIFPGQFLRASTIKALAIHTADDLGNAGPDYTFGWGLVNTKAAADLIALHAANPAAQRLVESTLSTAETNRTHAFTWDGAGAIRATLCWTDPPGAIQSGLDVTNRVLVNDLDLRIIGPTGQIYEPFVLSRASPATPATTGDNTLDTVEQVLVASPGVAGIYRAVVSLSGALTGATQAYAVVVSGSAGAAVCTATFDAQGGAEPFPASTNVRYGAAYGPLAVTSRAKHSFDGWWTGTNGAGQEVTASTVVTATTNHVLYAAWTRVETEQGTPYAWLDLHSLASDGDYEGADLADVDGDGFPAWQEYIAGSIPTNATSRLLTLIELLPGSPVISWIPDLGTARVYTVDGKTNLSEAAWGGTNANSRFFRTRVRLP